jgi:hypothetical protein
MKAIIQSITFHSDVEIEVVESDVHPTHFLIGYIPRLFLTSIVRKLKQESTACHLQAAQKRMSKNFWKEPDFLARRLLRLLNRRSKPRHCPSIYSFTRLTSFVPYIPQAKDL